jgi:hypothetical protein
MGVFLHRDADGGGDGMEMRGDSVAYDSEISYIKLPSLGIDVGFIISPDHASSLSALGLEQEVYSPGNHESGPGAVATDGLIGNETDRSKRCGTREKILLERQQLPWTASRWTTRTKWTFMK